MEAYLGYVDIINDDAAFSCFHNAEDGLYEGRFTTARPSHDSDFLPPRESAGDVFQHGREMLSIAYLPNRINAQFVMSNGNKIY